MDMKQLRAFLAVLDAGTFTAAARKLGMSQSAISQQVLALERQLGARLLTRTGHGVTPTPAGEILDAYARQILSKVDEARRRLSDYDTEGSGVLRIGAGGAVCEHLLPPVLRELQERFPRVELRLRSGSTPQTVRRVLRGALDVGLVTLPLDDGRLRVTEIGRDELVVAVAREHPWAGRAHVEPSELCSERLIVFERRSRTFGVVERALLQAGTMPRIAMELDHLGAVVAMVRLGLGVAVIPRWAAEGTGGQARLPCLSLGRRGLHRRLGAITRADLLHPVPVRAFLHSSQERLRRATGEVRAAGSGPP